MRQDDTTSRQDNKTNRKMTDQVDKMTSQIGKTTGTSRQGNIENRHHLFTLITQDHPPKIICTCTSQNLILKN